MNSKQGARYIKRRMGNDLKQKILIQKVLFQSSRLKGSHQFLIVLDAVWSMLLTTNTVQNVVIH